MTPMNHTCPRCGEALHKAEPDVGILSPGCPACHWFEGCEDTKTSPQPFRAGDAVEVLAGSHKGERWVVAVYEAARDTAWIAGWPCTMVDQATQNLRRVREATDAQHDQMIAEVLKLRGEHGESDPRQRTMAYVIANGGTP